MLDLIYDESGKPFALIYTNGTATPATYYYVLNLQGDVVALIDEEYNHVAQYTYNAWGEIITSSGTMAEINPLRYRGYFYDTETGFYYLQSRYYDPVTHRFINADGYASTGQEIIGTNMFAYCLNKPLIMTDVKGNRSYITVSTPEMYTKQDSAPGFGDGEYFGFDKEALKVSVLKIYHNIDKECAVDFYDTISMGDFGRYKAATSGFVSLVPALSDFFAFIGIIDSVKAFADERITDRDGRLLYLGEGYTVIEIERVYYNFNFAATESEYYIFDASYTLVFHDLIRHTHILE